MLARIWMRVGSVVDAQRHITSALQLAQRTGLPRSGIEVRICLPYFRTDASRPHCLLPHVAHSLAIAP
jgi:hypothetical protein